MRIFKKNIINFLKVRLTRILNEFFIHQYFCAR